MSESRDQLDLQQAMELLETSIKEWKAMVVANKQLLMLVNVIEKQKLEMAEQQIERERYVSYLESIINKHGWNPNDR